MQLAQFPRGGQRGYDFNDYDDGQNDLSAPARGTRDPYAEPRRYPESGRPPAQDPYYDDVYGQEDGKYDEDRGYYDDRGVSSVSTGSCLYGFGPGQILRTSKATHSVMVALRSSLLHY